MTSASPSGLNAPSVEDNSSDVTSLSITSRPGPIPGSRRLHLAHTSRVSKHRASVPSPHTPSFGSSDLVLSPILEAANLATTTTSTHQISLHSRLSRTTEHGESFMTPVATQTTPHLDETESGSSRRDYVQPCCVAARNEVDRLRRENAQLRTQVSELELSKENVDYRLKDLEERMKELGQTVDLLREEKVSGLLYLCLHMSHLICSDYLFILVRLFLCFGSEVNFCIPLIHRGKICFLRILKESMVTTLEHFGKSEGTNKTD